MRVLSFSYCFPNRFKTTWGVFVYHRLAALARLTDLQVVSPVPFFPVWNRLHGSLPPICDTWGELHVHRPRFFYMPGFLKWLDGSLYARGLDRPISELLAQWQPQILDAHFEWPDAVGVGHLARRFGLPYAVTMRGWLYEAMGRPRILPQCVQALKGADAVISVSRHLARTAEQLGVAPEKIHVIPNGVDLTRFSPQDKIEARRCLGLPQDGRLLVSVAHLGPRKGHREAIQALASLPDDVYLVLVGGDGQGGGANLRQLQKLVQQLDLCRRVLLVGPQSYDRIPGYLSAADVTVLASYREGCPNVVLESLACGTPVVASEVGAIPDLVQPGHNGLLVPPREVAPLAEALRSALEQSWSPQAIRRSEAVQPWSAVAARVRDVLANVAADRAVGQCTPEAPK